MSRRFRQFDWILLFSILGLIAAGMTLVYSASQVPAYPWKAGLFTRQTMWLVIGLVALFTAAAVPFRFWEEYSHLIYGVAMVVLASVLVIGVEREGARRWLSFGGFQFQPSELAKLATIMLVARLLSRPRLDITKLSALLPVLFAALVPFVLILLEPDLGTSLSLPAALVGMVFWAGFPGVVILIVATPLLSTLLSFKLWLWVPYLVLLLVFLRMIGVKRLLGGAITVVNLAAGFAAPVLWGTLHPYQQQRVLTMLNPESDPTNSGYQVIQSKIAIGSGGLAGKGFLEGTQKGLAFLPEQHTDFIFSVLGEEFGFIGCVLVLCLFALLIQRSVRLATKARSRFGAYLVVGIASMIMFHVAVNVSMTVGLAPVTGLPLPFLSYGGTFLLVTLIQSGLLLNVAFRRNEV